MQVLCKMVNGPQTDFVVKVEQNLYWLYRLALCPCMDGHAKSNYYKTETFIQASLMKIKQDHTTRIIEELAPKN